MTFEGKVVVITGGAGGIGSALAAKFLSAGARVCVADLEETQVSTVAAALGIKGQVCDVTREQDIRALIKAVEKDLGPIDVFVSNAGIIRGQPGDVASAGNDDWALSWQVHVMAHVYAARCLLPQMRARKSGLFIQIVSAAGLLNQIGDAAYSASKHAAVSFAESLAIEHGDEGIDVCLVCPQYVATDLIGITEVDADAPASLLSAEVVAERILDGALRGAFLILPHAEVGDYARFRANDHDAWIAGMRALKRKADAAGIKDPKDLYRLV